MHLRIVLGRGAQRAPGGVGARCAPLPISIARTVQQKLLASPRELAQRLLPLRHPLIDVAAALDDVPIAVAPREEVDGQAVGDEFVGLAAPVEPLRVDVARDLHAPESRAIWLE